LHLLQSLESVGCGQHLIAGGFKLGSEKVEDALLIVNYKYEKLLHCSISEETLLASQ
jgi:hypothetical protein